MRLPTQPFDAPEPAIVISGYGCRSDRIVRRSMGTGEQGTMYEMCVQFLRAQHTHAPLKSGTLGSSLLITFEF